MQTIQISSRPQEFTTEIIVEITADSEGHCIITLTSYTGRIRRMMGVNLIGGNNSIHIDNVDALEPGFYCLQVKNAKSKVLYSSLLTKP
jgi:hypothetical protein